LNFHYTFIIQQKIVFVNTKRKNFAFQSKKWNKNLHEGKYKCRGGDIMNMNGDDYRRYSIAHARKSPLLGDCLRAFLVGGSISAIGQGLMYIYGTLLSLSEDIYIPLVSITVATAAIVLTAFCVFDKIARFAGAGTLVPITGFANSVASPAIDSKAEGLVTGVGAKIFTVAGPVLLYGTLASTVYGVIYWILSMLV
jgi:stage V sporulation protein AC